VNIELELHHSPRVHSETRRQRHLRMSLCSRCGQR
jgi:hypothetical protein